jgi:diguanylate cyclase (GGDEF)-like protein/PAS domain S-box-containing protein
VAKLDKSVFHTDARFSRVDGSFVWARINVAAMHDGNVMLGYVQTVENITDRKSSEQGLSKAEEALFEEMERAQVTLNSIGDAVLTTDLQCNVTYLNSAAESITGWRRDEALGQPLTEVFNIMDATTRESAVNPARLAIDKDRAVELDANCVIVRRDGSESAIEDSSAPIHNRSGQVIGAVIVFRDVSNARAMADKMSHLALHDALTGLPNRLLLTERLSQAIGMARRNSKQLALLYIDLDHFKRVNDSLGHVAGDELLVLVARRLVECVRSTDTVCRQGGDEFVILLPEIEQAQDVTQVAEKLLAALKLPQLVAEKQLNVTMSIGISVYPDDGDTVDSLMINADNAMYDAKSGGRNNYRFFKADLNAAKQN